MIAVKRWYRWYPVQVYEDNGQVQFLARSNNLLEAPLLLCWRCVRHLNRQGSEFPVPSPGGNIADLLWQQNWSEMNEVHLQSLIPPSDGFPVRLCSNTS